MRYVLSYDDPNDHYLKIGYTVNELSGPTLEVQLPAWRPGRYELGNFAKNVQRFEVVGGSGKQLSANKITKDRWVIDLEGETTVTVHYNYYAFEMNAGSTFLDAEQLYVNPVNCFLYVEDRQSEPCEVELDIPDDYQVACSMKHEGKVMQAADFHELVDSPFICSAELVSRSYEVEGTEFIVWFNGLRDPDWDKLIADFKAFTSEQIREFGSIPCKEYHFLFQILPYTHYHGVEHWASTVISLGPEEKVMNDRYTDLLGVSSHELYHTWNIKNIRPAEMMPYDYARENYSRLGYVAEGVTTYMGDVFLLRSGVFDFDQYVGEFNKSLERHYHNFGRHHRSVAGSSFDTWLDGYVPGVPARKTSIYVEGSLCAMIADLMIMESTGNDRSLHEVMRLMYERFGIQNKGYTEADYLAVLEEVAGMDLKRYRDELLFGTADYTPWLTHALSWIGCELHVLPNGDELAANYGIKTVKVGDTTKVAVLAPGSPGIAAGLSTGDIITSSDGPSIAFKRNGIESKVELRSNDKSYFDQVKLKRMDSPTAAQEVAFKCWSAG